MSFVTQFFFPGETLSFLRVGIVLIGLYFLVKKILTRGKYSHYPPNAKGIYVPWLGHMFAFGTDPVKFFIECADQNGECTSFTLFGHDCVLMIGNEAQKVFYDTPEEVLSAAKAYKFTVPCFGPDVVYDATDHKFQQHRKMASSALTKKMFELYVPKIVDEVMKYMGDHYPEDEGIIDFSNAINEMTILTSTACLQGPEIRAQVHSGYAAHISALDHALSAIGFFYPSLPLPTYRARDSARRQLGAMFSAIIKHRRQSQFHGDDVLQVLMDSRHDDGTALTDNEIVGNLIALMMAGQHTSNITSSWTMINLLSTPGIFDRVNEELDEKVPPSGAPGSEFNYENINSLDFLLNCVKETLLKTPPIIVVWRTAMADFQYKDYIIPEGTLVCVSPPAYPRTKDSVYTNINEFDPDRFARGEHKTKTHSYFPFSSGRHACVGEKFGYLQITTILAVLARQFHLELIGTSADYPVDNTSLLAGPKGPIMIRYKKKH